MRHPAPLRWRKSSRSGSQSNCVEVAQTAKLIRDSKHKDVVLTIGQTGWTAFLAATKTDVYGTN